MTSTRRAGRYGFTLIELLTVMAIMALLASILLPSIFAAQQAAWTTKCNQNLHGLGTVVQQFATAHLGQYPPRDVGDPTQVSQYWKDTFRQEGHNPQVLYCPNECSGKVPQTADAEWVKPDPFTHYEILIGSPQININADCLLPGEARVWLRVDQVPSREMIAGDRMYNTGDSTDPETEGWFGNHADRLLGGKKGMVLGRNVLFGDYHVEWVSLDRSKTRVYMTKGATNYYLPDVVK